jgi:hypothetical protein
MNSNIIPYADIERMALAISKSKLFGITDPNQAIALMLVAQAEGMHPATAARDYHIVQGRPTLKADAMLARFITAGGSVKWSSYTDALVSATFSHPQGGTIEISWDMPRAKKAELGGKGMWVKYPRQMLRARVISEGVRTVYPGIAVGIYTPEEAQDMEPVSASTATGSPSPEADVWEHVRADVANDLHDYANRMRDAVGAANVEEIVSLQTLLKNYENEEQIAAWLLLDSKTRSTIKKIMKAREETKQTTEAVTQQEPANA